jgi:hypothetical protein
LRPFATTPNRLDQLTRVRRQRRARHKHIKTPTPRTIDPLKIQPNHLRRLAERHGANQHIRHTRTRLNVEMLGDRWPPQIGLQQQHPRTHPRRRARQMTRHRRLAITL